METITGKFHQYALRNVGGVMETRTSVDKWLKLTKGHNSGKKAVKHDLGIIWFSSGHGNNNWKVSLNPQKTATGVAEIRLTVEKLPKGYNSSKNQSSMTSIEYDHLQVMGTITRKFHQNPLNLGIAETRLCLRTDKWTDRKLTKGYNSSNPLKTVGGVADTRLCLRRDRQTDGRTHYYSLLGIMLGDKNKSCILNIREKTSEGQTAGQMDAQAPLPALCTSSDGYL